MKQLALLMVGLMFLGTGCATLRGDKQQVKVETDPTGATLTMGDQKFITPAVITLKRKDEYRITIAKEGYRPIAFNFTATWDGASMTDLVVPGGSALLGISAVTGSDREFNRLAKITLEKTSERNPAVLEVYQFRGKLLTKHDYDKAVEEEQKDTSRFMGRDNS